MSMRQATGRGSYLRGLRVTAALPLGKRGWFAVVVPRLESRLAILTAFSLYSFLPDSLTMEVVADAFYSNAVPTPLGP